MESHGQAEWDPGGWGTPETSHRSPISYSTGARCPCCPPRRSFPSCPAAVPSLPGPRKIAPSPREAEGRTRGRRARSRRGRVAVSRRRRGSRVACSLGSGAAPAGSGPRQGTGELSGGCMREETGGGSRRRGGRGAGGEQRLGGGAQRGGQGPAASPRPTSAPKPPPLSPASVRKDSRGPTFGIFGTLGRMLAREEGWVGAGTRDAARVGPRALKWTSPLRIAGLGPSSRG